MTPEETAELWGRLMGEVDAMIEAQIEEEEHEHSNQNR